jgi:hypothetical protein
MFYSGLDLGKKHDHTAIAIVERRGVRLLVRHLERVGLGRRIPGWWRGWEKSWTGSDSAR